MRWKTGRGRHDARHLDLIATFALLIAIVGAWHFFSAPTPAPAATAFIVPSQSVHW